MDIKDDFELDSENNFDEEPPIGDGDIDIVGWLSTQELETLSPEDAMILAEERMAKSLMEDSDGSED